MDYPSHDAHRMSPASDPARPAIRHRRAILAAAVATVTTPGAPRAAPRDHHRHHNTTAPHAKREPSAPANPAPTPASPPAILYQPWIPPPEISVAPAPVILPTDPLWKSLVAPGVALLSAIVSAGSVFYASQTYRLSRERDRSTLAAQRAETERTLALQAFEHRVARPIGGTLDVLEALLAEIRGLAPKTNQTEADAAVLSFSARATLELTTCQHRCQDADRTISRSVGAQTPRVAVFADALAAHHPLDALIAAARAALSGQEPVAGLSAYHRLSDQVTSLQSALRRLLETERNAEAARHTLRVDDRR